MANKNIKTSHELADLLESVVELLRIIPEYELSEASQGSAVLSNCHQKFQKRVQESQVLKTVNDLADQLPSLGRKDAEAEIKALTRESMRQLASSLKIRTPSKATKSEIVDILLAQVFDVPSGQERIRTFHKRNSVS